MVMLLIIKRKMVYGISCDDLLFLLRKTTKIVLRNTYFNAVGVALFRRNPSYILVRKNLNLDTTFTALHIRIFVTANVFVGNVGVLANQT